MRNSLLQRGAVYFEDHSWRYCAAAVVTLFVTGTVCFGNDAVADVDAVVAKIDAEVAARWESSGVTPTEDCDEPTFVRRVYLDLAGRIPTVDEARAYLADEEKDRRARLIDALLASDEYAVRMADVFDEELMGRVSADNYRGRIERGWRAYLERVFRENRPWDQVAREVLLARPTGNVDHGAAEFLAERNNHHQSIAEAIAPAFFGIRIECAQCHDHPMAAMIEQAHYWGLVAFYRRGTNVDSPHGRRVAESAVGGYDEFADLSGSSHANLLAFVGAETVSEERPDGDEEENDDDALYRPADVEGAPRVPLFSRRAAFVEQVLDGHPLVARAMVNRLWAIFLGRGIVHPHDEMDDAHEASHEELLDWLAEDFRASGHDIRRMVGAMVRARAYGLSSVKPDGVDDPADFAWFLPKPLTAEQFARSAAVALRGEATVDDSVMAELRGQFPEVLPETPGAKVSQALFLSNNPTWMRFVRESRGTGSLVDEMLAAETDDGAAEVAFERVFGRAATDEERTAAAEYLAVDDAEAKAARVEGLVWALVTGAEFRMNH